MSHIPVTLAAAGILGLLYMALSFNVVWHRQKSKTLLGDGDGREDAKDLVVAIRAHGNLAEYVPFALILMAGVEAAGASRALMLVLAAALVVSRVLHPVGLAMNAPNFPRAAGSMITWLVMIVASIEAILRAL